MKKFIEVDHYYDPRDKDSPYSINSTIIININNIIDMVKKHNKNLIIRYVIILSDNQYIYINESTYWIVRNILLNISDEKIL